MGPGSGDVFGTGAAFASVRGLAQRYMIVQNGSDGAHEPFVRRHRFG